MTEKQELEKVLYICLLNDLTEKQELKKVLYSGLLNDLTEKQELRCCTAANSTI